MDLKLNLNVYTTLEEEEMYMAGSPELNIMAYGSSPDEAEDEFFRLAERVLRYYKWNGRLDNFLDVLGWEVNGGEYVYTRNVEPPKGKVVRNKEVERLFVLPNGAPQNKVYYK